MRKVLAHALNKKRNEETSCPIWTPSTALSRPVVTSLDKRFDKYRVTLASVERLYDRHAWGEGPVWFGDGALPALERHSQ